MASMMMENTSSILAENTTVSNISNISSGVVGSATSPVSTASSHGLIGWIFYFIASLIVGVTRLFVWALSIATITVPTLIFKILSVSFTLTLNFSSLYRPRRSSLM
jgi:lysophospholipid hydrolase